MPQQLTITLPDELLALCRRDHTDPETIVRGFIADLCAATSLEAEQHLAEQGYRTRGSDERGLAFQYYDRAGYNTVPDDAS